MNDCVPLWPGFLFLFWTIQAELSSIFHGQYLNWTRVCGQVRGDTYVPQYLWLECKGIWWRFVERILQSRKSYFWRWGMAFPLFYWQTCWSPFLSQQWSSPEESEPSLWLTSYNYDLISYHYDSKKEANKDQNSPSEWIAHNSTYSIYFLLRLLSLSK